jgi:glycosyltransferase involved in cell wall biosynthesis
LITCIVPVYNGELYLREAVDSIRSQTYPEVEIIIVDDGSTDGTAAIIAEYGAIVRPISQPNAGPPSARNRGLAAARGEFVAFLDADDVWHVEKLQQQMARFRVRPELDACVTHIQNFWIPELHEEAERLRDHRLARAVPGYTTQTLLARRTLFDVVGQFSTAVQHGDSTEWFLRASEHGAKIDVLAAVLVRRRLHHSNRTRRLAAASRDTYVDIVKAALDRRRHRGARADSPVGAQDDQR